ncbi:MAG TPA: type IV secretory system conjugative DNA transfer family protein [Streptosporangiaceae bacterium]|nr:type IV secretory system conjugative DNA transfer family protein [Streptosporangiaceae bacterium]
MAITNRGGAVGVRFKKFMGDWVGEASGSHANGKSKTTVDDDVTALCRRYDPWPTLVGAQNRTEVRHSLVIGTKGNGDLVITASRRNLLILGPPRSEKTAGVLIPAILGHPGPVVPTSTKADVLRATGLVRARLGRIWHYSPDGAPTPPGCATVRWSPIPTALNWASAVALGKSMADVAEIGNGPDSGYFRTKSGVLIAALLHAAAIENKEMLWMMRAAAGDARVLAEVSDILNGSFAPRPRSQPRTSMGS